MQHDHDDNSRDPFDPFSIRYRIVGDATTRTCRKFQPSPRTFSIRYRIVGDATHPAGCAPHNHDQLSVSAIGS